MGITIGRKDEYAVSTWTFEREPIGGALSRIAAGGFRKVEFWADKVHLDPRIFPDLKRIRLMLEDRGMEVHSMHAPFSDIADGGISPEFIQTWSRLLIDTLDECAFFETHLMVMHVLGRKLYNWKPAESEPIATMIDGLCREARSRGVRILLENLADGTTPGEFRCSMGNLVRAFGNLDVDWCIDIGHTLLSGEDPFTAIEVAGSGISSVHVSNNDGVRDLHASPVEGLLDWPALKSRMRGNGYNGDFVLEVSGAEGSGAAFQRIRSLFEE